MDGRLITFEGLDGVGKTTHVSMLMDWLTEAGYRAATYREPGATHLGEELRKLLKAGRAHSAYSELLLFAAARAELVAKHLKPDLASGAVVVLDRFSDSTYAYQGALGIIPMHSIQRICEVAAEGVEPDLTLWLDLDPLQAVRRRDPVAVAANGGERLEPDAFEQRDLEYFSRVRALYSELHQATPKRIARINATGSIKETGKLVVQVVTERMKEWACD